MFLLFEVNMVFLLFEYNLLMFFRYHLVYPHNSCLHCFISLYCTVVSFFSFSCNEKFTSIYQI